MAIQPKPSVDGFIGKAPDAETAETGAPGPRQPKKQITVTLDPGLIERIDALGRRMGQTRSAVVGILAFEALEARDEEG